MCIFSNIVLLISQAGKPERTQKLNTLLVIIK